MNDLSAVEFSDAKEGELRNPSNTKWMIGLLANWFVLGVIALAVNLGLLLASVWLVLKMLQAMDVL